MRLRFFIVVFFLFLALLTPSHAQKPPQTLADALSRVDWDASKRGALIAVAPAEVFPVPNAAPPRVGPSGLDVRAVAAFFGRQIVKFPSLSVLAPLTRLASNAPPAAPNLLAGLDRDDVLRLLMLSLTPTQWRAAGGAAGLGRGELDEKQRAIFEALLPEPFAYDEKKAGETGQGDVIVRARRLTESERAGVRLRLILQPRVNARSRQGLSESVAPKNLGDGWIRVLTNRNRGEDGKPFLTLEGDADYSDAHERFGAAAPAEVPNTLKGSQINFDALTPPVSLDGAATVGELTRRIGVACHIEIYVDARRADVPLWTRGASAFSGDALRALCLALKGAVRQVGPAYVLTDDVAGQGARQAVWNDWLDDARTKRDALLHQFDGALGLSNPGQYLTWDADEPLKFSPQIVKDWLQKPYYTAFPLAALTSSQQKYVRESAVFETKYSPARGALDLDTLFLSIRPNLVFALPDGTQIVTTIGPSLEDLTPRKPEATPKPPIPTLESLTHRTLLVTARTEKEAREAVTLAKTLHFERVWLPVSDGDGNILNAAIAAGQAVKLPVGAVFRLRSTAGEIPDADVNILGEPVADYQKRRGRMPTRNWFAPGSGAWRGREDQLLTLAQTPGLSALILRDWAAPGSDPSEETNYRRLDGAASEVGDTLENRLSYLRQSQIDPIDILPPRDGPTLKASEIADSSRRAASPAAWHDARTAENAQAMAALFGRLQAARHALPLILLVTPVPNSLVLLTQPDAADRDESYFCVWNAPDKLPVAHFHLLNETLPPHRAEDTRRQSKTAWFRIKGGETTSGDSEPFPEAVRDTVRLAGRGWDGTVLDFSGIRLDEAAKKLDSLPRVEKR